jgi:hypothetical protein
LNQKPRAGTGSLKSSGSIESDPIDSEESQLDLL